MKHRLASHAVTVLVRTSLALMDLAHRLVPHARVKEPPPVVVYDAMSDEDLLAQADGEILRAAFRGVTG